MGGLLMNRGNVSDIAYDIESDEIELEYLQLELEDEDLDDADLEYLYGEIRLTKALIAKNREALRARTRCKSCGYHDGYHGEDCSYE